MAGMPENRRVPPKSGPVAQLGARFHGMEEVIGSIPIRSTKQPLFDVGWPRDFVGYFDEGAELFPFSAMAFTQ